MNHYQKTVWFFTVLSILIIAASQPPLRSYWPEDQISIDGNPSDWGYNINYFEQGAIGLGIGNDTDNLYFIVSVAENGLQQQIVRGLNLWVDVDGGTDQDYGIQYPARGFPNQGVTREMPEGMPGQSNGEFPTDPEARREMFQGMRGQFGGGDGTFDVEQALERATDFAVMRGNNTEQITESVENNQRGIELKMASWRNELVYEGKIPFTELSGTGSDIGRIIGIGITLPERGLPGGETGDETPSQGTAPEGGFDRGGDTQFGGSRFSGGNTNFTPTTLDLWNNFTLATES